MATAQPAHVIYHTSARLFWEDPAEAHYGLSYAGKNGWRHCLGLELYLTARGTHDVSVPLVRLRPVNTKGMAALSCHIDVPVTKLPGLIKELQRLLFSHNQREADKFMKTDDALKSDPLGQFGAGATLGSSPPHVPTTENSRPTPLPPVRAEAVVLCSGGRHRVRFDGRRLILLDHPDLGKERLLSAFSYDCRCLQIRQAWRDGHRKGIPRGLREAFRRHRVVVSWERSRNRLPQLDFLAKPRDEYVWPIIQTISDAVTASLDRCHYRKTNGDNNVTVHICDGGVWPSVRHQTSKHTERRGSGLRTTTNSTSIFRVGAGWLHRVHRRGLAVVEHRLVLAVVTENDLAHYRDRVRVRPDYRPWWVGPFGIEPDLGRGVPAIIAQSSGYNIFPACVWLRRDSEAGAWRIE